MGHVSLTKKQLADPERLQREATAYALRFNEEENGLSFAIGCSDFITNRAFYLDHRGRKSARWGKPDLALDLLNMAVKDVKRTEARQ